MVADMPTNLAQVFRQVMPHTHSTNVLVMLDEPEHTLRNKSIRQIHPIGPTGKFGYKTFKISSC